MNTDRFGAAIPNEHLHPGPDRETRNRILDATDAPCRAASSRLCVRVCGIHRLPAGRPQSALHEQCLQSFDLENGPSAGLCGSNQTGRGARVSDHPRISPTRGPVPTRTGPLCISARDFGSTRFRTHNRIDRFTVCSLAAAINPAPTSVEAVLFKSSSRYAAGTGRSSESHHAGVPQLVEGCVANAKVAGSSPAACSTSGVPLHSVQRSHGNGWAGCARLAACSERTHTGPCVLALGHSRSGRDKSVVGSVLGS